MVSCGERCYCCLDDNVRKRVMRISSVTTTSEEISENKDKNKSDDAKA